MSTVTSPAPVFDLAALPVHQDTTTQPASVRPISDLPPLEKVELVNIDVCNLCGSTERELLLTAADWTSRVAGRGTLDVVLCRRCGLLYLAKTLPKEVLEYPSKHGGSLLYGMPLDKSACRKYFLTQQKKGTHAVSWIESHIGPLEGKRTLDILSGTGGIVQAFISRGAHAEGLEPSALLAGYGKSVHNLCLHEELLENFHAEPPFDMITGLQMLNHYLDPTAVLLQIRSLLSPSGYLFLETLNFPHAIRRKPLKSCVHVDHPVMFTPETMCAFLEKAGFEVEALETDQLRQHDFGSKNHMHVLARVAGQPRLYCPSATAAVDTKLACLTSLAQYGAAYIDQHSGRGRHFIGGSGPVKRTLRQLRSMWRRA